MSVATASEELLLAGFNARTPWKATCRVASSSNLTLAGEQTIDGVACVVGDRVLVTAQTAPKENGIYVVATGAWTRAKDFRAENSAQLQTIVMVAEGSANSGLWRMTSPTTGTVEPGITSTTWAKSLPGGTIAGDLAVTGSLTVGGSPVGAAATDALTAKLAVRARMPAQTAIPSTAVTDGGVTSSTGDRILLDSLTTQSSRGIYIASNGGAWARAADFDSSADIANGALVIVVAGTDAGKLYQLDQLGATLGSTSLSFSQVGSISESQLRTAAAALAATLDVNGQTVSDCAGVVRTGGNIAITTTTSGDIGLTSAGNIDISAPGNDINVTGTVAFTGAVTGNGEQIDRLPIATSSAGSAALAFGSGINLLTSAATARSLPNITASDVGRIIAVRLASGGSCVVTPDGADTVNGSATDTIDATAGRVVRSYLATTTSTWETLS